MQRIAELLFNASPIPSWICEGESLRFVAANDSACRQYGLEVADFCALRPDELAPGVAPRLAHAEPAGKNGDGGWRHHFLDETTLDLRLRPEVLELEGERYRLLTAEAVTPAPTGRSPAPRDLRRLEMIGQVAARLARIAGWELDAATRMMRYTEEMKAILAVQDVGPLLFEQSLKNVDEADQERIATVIEACLTEGRAFDEHMGVTDGDGEHKWLRTIGEPERAPDGTIIGVIGTVQDLTARRSAETERRILQTAVGFAHHCFIIQDARREHDTRRIVYVNDAFCRMTGYEPAEVIGGVPAQFFGPATSFTTIEEIRTHMSEGRPFRAEYAAYTKPGEEIWIEQEGTPAYAPDGSITHWISIVRDLGAERRSQEATRAMEERLRLLSQAINDLVWDWDVPSGAIWWNDNIERIMGFPAAELPDIATWLTHVHEADRERLRIELEDLVAGSESSWQSEYRFVRKDGCVATLFERGFVVRDDEGRARRIIGSTVDLTEQRALQEQLFQSQKLEALGKLTGGVAHDFNNLLTIIMGNAETIASDLPRDSELRPLAEMTLKASEQAAELTRRLLAYSRRQTLSPSFLDVTALVRQMMPLFERTLGEGARMRFLPEIGTRLVRVDAGQLEAALLNLVVNARDALVNGEGMIEIETANVVVRATTEPDDLVAGNYVMLLVRDNGIGMTKAIAEQAFDPFFTTKPVGEGSGLGLSMVYGFVRQSGGHVRIESDSGRGTAVKLFLPAAIDLAESQAAAARRAATSGGGETVLIAEDEALVRKFVVTQIESLGYRPMAVPDGRAALDLLGKSGGVDLLVTDIAMAGGMDGFELAARALELQPDLRILFTSGHPATIPEQLAARGFPLLRKPYHRQDLATALKQAMRA
jgi:PAS domain S-box-containing protein